MSGSHWTDSRFTPNALLVCIWLASVSLLRHSTLPTVCPLEVAELFRSCRRWAFSTRFGKTLRLRLLQLTTLRSRNPRRGRRVSGLPPRQGLSLLWLYARESRRPCLMFLPQLSSIALLLPSTGLCTLGVSVRKISNKSLGFDLGFALL